MLTSVRDGQWDDFLIVVALVIGLLWDPVSATLSNDRKAFLIRLADPESDMSVFSSPQHVQLYSDSSGLWQAHLDTSPRCDSDVPQNPRCLRAFLRAYHLS